MPLSAVGASGSGGVSNPQVDQATKELERIREQIEDLARRQADGEEIDFDNLDKVDLSGGTQVTPGRQVTEYRKEVNDVRNDTIATARDIGVLVKNNSRLNVITSLRDGDTVDHFRFRVHRAGEMRLGEMAVGADKEQEDSPIRVQLLDRMGRVVADSGAREGSDAKDAYDALRNGALEVDAGDYYLRVTRAEGDGAREAKGNKVDYGLQLTMGTYHNDFDTVERAAQQGQDDFQLPIMAQGVIESLSAGIGLVASLPPIGQSASDKLMGHLVNQLF